MDSKEIQKQVFRKLLSNPKTLPGYLNKISPDDFTIPLARTVISALQQNGYSVHFAPSKEYFNILLREKIMDKQELETACEMLANLSQKPQQQGDLDVLLKELKRERMCGELTKILRDMVPHINPVDVEKTYDSLMKQLLRLPMSAGDGVTTGQLKEVYGDVDDRIGMYFKPMTRKFPCGLKAFDKNIGGFAPGEMIVLTAGTGQGKSAVMLWWAGQYLKAGANVVYATLEMSYEEVMDRYHAMITGLVVNDIRNKRLDEKNLSRYIEGIIANSKDPSVQGNFLRECASTIVDRRDPKHALELAAKYPDKKNKFYVLDIPRGCSPARMDREISRLSMDNKIDVVFVDYLNIMEPNFHSKDWVREQGELSKDLKAVARKTETLIFTGAQLNTSNIKEGEKITTDNIKYARAICENSDWVIGFHRDADDIAMKHLRLELTKHRFSAACAALLEVDFGNMQVKDLGDAEDHQAIPA